MKTGLRKSISILLVLIMILGLTAVSASAETKTFKNYCSIGDSVAQFYPPDGSDRYPVQVAKSLNVKKHNPISLTGLRSKDLLYALGGIYEGTVTKEQMMEDDAFWKWSDTATYGVLDELMELRNEGTLKKVKAANLISIEVGVGDVFYYAQSLCGIDDIDAINGGLSTAELANIAKTYVQLLWEGYHSLCTYYPKVLQRIRELNTKENCTIVCVGSFNPISQARLTEDLDLPIGNVGMVISEAINARIKEFAKAYGCIFVDIADVELGIMETGVSFEGGAFNTVEKATLATHPSSAGYAYIARQIVAAVSEKDMTTPLTYIQVDLGSYTNVTNVVLGLNTLYEGQYTFDPNSHLLVVKTYSSTENLLTVTTQHKNGATGTQIYALSYSAQEGYFTRMIYQSLDVVKSVSLIANTFSTVSKLMVQTVVDWFKK